MDIVLNEVVWAENALTEKTLGKHPSETLGRVAKYFIYEKGMSQSKARIELENFLIACEPTASKVMWEKTIDRAIRYGAKFRPIKIDSIIVTTDELSAIDALRGTQLRRLAFTLLCISKYMNAINGDIDYWVNTPDRDVMRMANINTSVKRQSLMYGQLRDAGMIRFSKRVDNLSIQVLFASESGVPEIYIRDFRNLGYRYMMRTSQQYYECERCGLVCKESDGKTKGRKRKYCVECSVKVKTAQSVNSVMNRRKYVNGKDNPYVVYMHEFPDGKRYIGMTGQPLTRRWGNGHGYDDQPDVSMAIAKYGWDSVRHYLLFENLTKEQAYDRWIEAIRLYKTYMPEYGYNRAFTNIISKDLTCKPVDIGVTRLTPIMLDNHGKMVC